MGPASPSTRARIALVLVPSLLLIVLAEVGTRAFLLLRYGQQVPTGNWTFEYEPYLVMKRSGKVHRDHPVRGDQYRVLLLGGSTADQIPDDTFREAVQAYTEREVVIINLAESGYILNQEKVMLILRGIREEPDLIVTLDGANDFATTAKLHRTGEVYQSRLVSLAVEHPFLNAIFAVARKSQFVNALVKWREREAERAFEEDVALEEDVIDHLIEGWEAISIVAKGMGVPYVMVLQPYVHLKSQTTQNERALSAGYDYRRALMTRMFRQTYQRMSRHAFAGNPYVVDGTRFFDEMSEVDVFKDEVHLTREGNHRLVREILRVPLSRGLRIPRGGDEIGQARVGGGSRSDPTTTR